MKIELGKIYTDRVTGFRGVATARCEYLYDSNKVLLTHRGLSGASDVREYWFPAANLTNAVDVGIKVVRHAEYSSPEYAGGSSVPLPMQLQTVRVREIEPAKLAKRKK